MPRDIIFAFGVHQNFFQGWYFSVADLFDRAGEFGVVGIEGKLFSDFVFVVVIEDAAIDAAVIEEIPWVFVRTATVKDNEFSVLVDVVVAASNLEDVQLDPVASNVVATREGFPRVFEFCVEPAAVSNNFWKVVKELFGGWIVGGVGQVL